MNERRIPLEELLADIRSGAVTEVFACGTAAVVTPIGRLGGSNFDHTIADGGAGELTLAIRGELTDIQNGRAADRHGWMTRLA
ncbi:Branched-chain-amino-acid aminotransferase [compost metagenome]